jgi:hypothetical protein
MLKVIELHSNLTMKIKIEMNNFMQLYHKSTR